MGALSVHATIQTIVTTIALLVNAHLNQTRIKNLNAMVRAWQLEVVQRQLMKQLQTRQKRIKRMIILELQVKMDHKQLTIVVERQVITDHNLLKMVLEPQLKTANNQLKIDPEQQQTMLKKRKNQLEKLPPLMEI